MKPDLRVREIRSIRKQGVVVLGQSGAVLVRDPVNGVSLNPSDGRPASVFDGSTLTAHQRLSEMADPLNFGTFGGLWTKLIWFVFGLMLTALSVTGVMIYAMRLAREQADHSGATRAGRGMGAWGYVCVALILIALALTPRRHRRRKLIKV